MNENIWSETLKATPNWLNWLSQHDDRVDFDSIEKKRKKRCENTIWHVDTEYETNIYE